MRRPTAPEKRSSSEKRTSLYSVPEIRHKHASRPFLSAVKVRLTSALLIAAQDGMLPLHWAVGKGASAEVVTLLLDANKDSATAKDGVCRAPQPPPHAAAPRLCGRTLCVVGLMRRACRCLTRRACSLRRVEGCRCTSPSSMARLRRH